MGVMDTTEVPPGHTPEGGVLVGSDNARTRLVVFEDSQCPYCREFEDASGDLLRREVAGRRGGRGISNAGRFSEMSRSVPRMLWPAAAGTGKFDELRRELFAEQPPEHSGGFSTEVLVELGRRVGLTGSEYVAAVREGRYERWVREIDEAFQEQDAQGTPFALLDGRPGPLRDAVRP